MQFRLLVIFRLVSALQDGVLPPCSAESGMKAFAPLFAGDRDGSVSAENTAGLIAHAFPKSATSLRHFGRPL